MGKVAMNVLVQVLYICFHISGASNKGVMSRLWGLYMFNSVRICQLSKVIEPPTFLAEIHESSSFSTVSPFGVSASLILTILTEV